MKAAAVAVVVLLVGGSASADQMFDGCGVSWVIRDTGGPFVGAAGAEASTPGEGWTRYNPADGLEWVTCIGIHSAFLPGSFAVGGTWTGTAWDFGLASEVWEPSGSADMLCASPGTPVGQDPIEGAFWECSEADAVLWVSGNPTLPPSGGTGGGNLETPEEYLAAVLFCVAVWGSFLAGFQVGS